MKKTYLFILGLSLSFSSFAQKNEQFKRQLTPEKGQDLFQEKQKPKPTTKVGGDVIFSETFNGSSNGWTTSGPDSLIWLFDTNGPNGQYAAASGNDIITSTTASNGFMIFDADLSNTPGTAATFVDRSGSLVSPIIDISQYTDAKISFEEEYRHCCSGSFYPAVDVSTDGFLTFTTFNATNGNGANDRAGTITKELFLSNFMSGATNLQNFQFRFNFDGVTAGTSHYFWQVDDIKIEEVIGNDISLGKTFAFDIINAYDYSIVKGNQIQPLTVGVIMSNLGLQDAVSATIDVKINDGISDVYNAPATFNLNSFITDTLWIPTGFTPLVNKSYTVSFSLPLDDNITNNLSTPASFQTSDAVYAHNFEGSGVYRFNQDEETSMGNTFEIITNVTLPAASVKFETGTTATTANVNLWRFNPDDANGFTSVQAMEFIDEVDYSILPSDIASGEYTTIPFNTPIDLEAGWFYVLSVKKFEGPDRIFIAGSSEGDEDLSTVCYGPFGTGGGINFFISWGFAPSVRMAFQDAPVVTSDDSDNILCTGSSLILTSSAATGNQWQMDGVDIIGQTGTTLTVNASGSYTCIAGGFSSLATNVSISTTDNTTITSTDGTILTANQSGATYQWINCTTTSPVAGATNQLFAPTENGSYQVNITLNGCPMVTSACTAVLLPLEVTSSDADNILCSGSSLTLTSSLADGNNVWSDGTNTLTTDFITVTTAGTWTLTNTVTVQTADPIVVTLLTLDNTLTGTTTLTATQASGATYQWMQNCNVASAALIDETTQAFTPLSDGDYSVEITLNGCSVTSTCTTVSLPLAINSIGNLSVCAGGTLDLTSTKTSGNQWQKDGADIVGATAQSYTATATGVYTCLNNSVVSNPITFTVAAPVIITVTQSTNTVDMSADQTTADYKWVNCANPSVALATTQAFTATANGSYQVIVTVGTCSDTSSCKIVQGVGITENTAFASFSVYPNPAADNVAIDYALKNESSVTVSISDLSGKVVYTSKLGSKTAGSHNLSVNTSSFANGIYVVNFATTNGIVTEKLVVRK